MIGNAFDILRSDYFALGSMIARIDKAPYVPGLGTTFFRGQSIDTTSAEFEVRDNVISLVQTSARGARGATQTDLKREMRSIAVPHVQVNDTILADQIQNKREFGTTNQLQTVETVVNRRLEIGKRNLAATIERHCMTALQGASLDADGATLASAYTLFGVSANTEVAFDLTNAATTGPVLRGLCDDIVLAIQDNLKMGAVEPQIMCLMSPGFRRAFANHSAVQASYDRAMGVHQLSTEIGGFGRESHVRQPPFYWQGIWWQEYRGGSSYVPDDKAIFFPVVPTAMEELYPLIFAPADYVDTVNTLGLPFYARVKVEEKCADVEMQTNPLAICTRPLSLFMGRKGA